MLKNDQRREEKMLELEAMDVGIEVAPSVGVLWEKLILGRQTTISEYQFVCVCVWFMQREREGDGEGRGGEMDLRKKKKGGGGGGKRRCY